MKKIVIRIACNNFKSKHQLFVVTTKYKQTTQVHATAFDINQQMKPHRAITTDFQYGKIQIMIDCNQIIQLIVAHGNTIQLAVMLNMQIHFYINDLFI